MRRTIRFLHGDRERALTGVDPTTTVLEWLRRDERRTGTKEGCAEGDCGACTVVLARPEGSSLRYEPINACIRFLPTLDSCQLLTVEDARPRGGALHPVQAALVEHHGSQCGFCTPGIVMALLAAWKNGELGDAHAVDDALAGNLCRCTGYGPIAAAAAALGRTAGNDDHLATGAGEVLARLDRLADDLTLVVEGAGTRFFAPVSEAALADLVLEHQDAVVLAGGTDVGLWVTKQHRRLATVIWLGRVEALQRIEESADAIELGAGVTYKNAAPVLARAWPGMDEIIRRLGAAQVRACGTIGGNIANGSPIGDMAPLLIAAGARLVLRRGGTRRVLPLEDFFQAYGRQDRRPGEYVARIIVDKARPGSLYRAYKLAKRFDQDVSAVCAGFHVVLEGDVVGRARLAFGGMAATPRRAAAAEAALIGRPWTRETVETAMTALAADFQPISDMRASAAYRLKAARNLLLKFWIEAGGTDLRLRAARQAAHG